MNNRVEAIARKRVAACQKQIRFALEKIQQGNPFAAEQNEVRRRRRLEVKAGMTPRAAEAMSEKIERYVGIKPVSLHREEALPSEREDRRERLWGDTVDFVNVAFLERGAQIARSVGRIAYRNGRAQGTGVLIGSGLLLTNNHVIESATQAGSFMVEFDYERDWAGHQRDVTRFVLDPSIFLSLIHI